MAYVVTAKWTAKEGQEEVVAGALAKLAGPSRAEEGVLSPSLTLDPESPRVFFIYEQYRSQADYEAHGASQHFQQFGVGEAFPALETRERGVLRDDRRLGLSLSPPPDDPVGVHRQVWPVDVGRRVSRGGAA